MRRRSPTLAFTYFSLRPFLCQLLGLPSPAVSDSANNSFRLDRSVRSRGTTNTQTLSRESPTSCNLPNFHTNMGPRFEAGNFNGLCPPAREFVRDKLPCRNHVHSPTILNFWRLNSLQQFLNFTLNLHPHPVLTGRFQYCVRTLFPRGGVVSQGLTARYYLPSSSSPLRVALKHWTCATYLCSEAI